MPLAFGPPDALLCNMGTFWGTQVQWRRRHAFACYSPGGSALGARHKGDATWFAPRAECLGKASGQPAGTDPTRTDVRGAIREAHTSIS
jgi:hypothetical protein